MDKWGLYDEVNKIAADSDLLVRYLYEADLKVYYLKQIHCENENGGAFYRCGEKDKLKWAEDLRMYKSHGIKPISALKGKIHFKDSTSSLKPDCRGVKYRKQRKKA